MRWSTGRRGRGAGSAPAECGNGRGVRWAGRRVTRCHPRHAVPWSPRRPSAVRALTYSDSQLICLVLLKVLYFICFANLLLSAFKYVSLPEESPGNMN